MSIQTAATDQLKITYGSFALAAANGIELQGDRDRYQLSVSHRGGSFSCEFVLRLGSPTGTQDTDDAAFGALVAAAIASLRLPNQRLLIQQGSRTVEDFNPDAGTLTAFDVQPLLEKTGSQDDAGHVRRYRWSLTFTRPADESGYGGRSSGMFEVFTTFQGRRVAVGRGSVTALPGQTAKQTYEAAATDTWITSQLPSTVTGGEWTKVEDRFSADDHGFTGTFERTYWEAVYGLRSYETSLSCDEAQIATVAVSGTYQKTATFASGKAAHDAATGVGTLVAAALSALAPGCNFDAKPASKEESANTTGELYTFRRVYPEIVEAQGDTTDLAEVVKFELDVRLARPTPGDARLTSTTPKRLRPGMASYRAAIDKTVTTDLRALWESKLRARVLSVCRTRLGAAQVILTDESVTSLVAGNRIAAELAFVVVDSPVISLSIRERVARTPAKRPVPRGDGKPHAYFLYEQPPTRTLERSARVVQLAGAELVPLFQPGEAVSGISLVDTGRTAEADLDLQESGAYTLAQGRPQGGTGVAVGGWICRGLSDPDVEPSTIGGSDGTIDVVTRSREESWLYAASLETGPTLGQASGLGGPGGTTS